MEIQESSLPVFYLSRALGLAPFILKRSDKGYIESIKLNYWLCAYGVLFLTATASLTFRLMVIGSGSQNPVQKLTVTSKFVNLFNVSIVICVCAFGVVAGIMGSYSVREFNRKLNEADKELVLFNDRKQDKKRGIIILSVVFTAITGLMIMDVLWRSMKIQGQDDESDVIYTVSCLPFYLLYFIMMAIQTQLAQTVLTLARRYRRLNLAIESAFSLTTRKAPRMVSTITRTGYFLDRLASTHAILGESVSIFSASYGPTLVALLTSCLLHLVATIYFFLLDLFANTDVFGASLQFLWICFHVARLLLIVEPCHMASVEGGRTIVIVCEILRGCKDSAAELLLKRLWRQLLADRSYVFSACDMCLIDRQILTSLSGAIATYLVILIQFQKTDG